MMNTAIERAECPPDDLIIKHSLTSQGRQKR